MDMMQDFLMTYLTPNMLSSLTTHSATYYRILSTILTIRSLIFKIFNPLITRLIDSPDAASILLLILVLFVSFKVVDLLWRTFMFWVRVAVRLIFWGSILAIGLWVYNRGFRGVSTDLNWAAREANKEYAGWQRRAQLVNAGEQIRRGRRYG